MNRSSSTEYALCSVCLLAKSDSNTSRTFFCLCCKCKVWVRLYHDLVAISIWNLVVFLRRRTNIANYASTQQRSLSIRIIIFSHDYFSGPDYPRTMIFDKHGNFNIRVVWHHLVREFSFSSPFPLPLSSFFFK